MKRSKSLSSGVNNMVALRPNTSSGTLQPSTRRGTTPPKVPPKPARGVHNMCISMSDLCSKMKNELPVTLAVTQGTYGVTTESTFSEDEQLTAHFVQAIDHVIFRPFDSCERPMYRVPVDSSNIVSVIYNPKRKLDEALMGYVFPSPSHLINSEPANMPLLVAVVKEHVDNDNPQYSVELNDVLIVKKITKAGKKRVIECIHAISGLTKLIKEDSKVRLSTRPEQVSLTLKTILQYIHLPIEVLITIPPNPELTAGKTLVGVMSKRSMVQNVICTRSHDFNDYTDENHLCTQQLYAIPESFELDCQHLKYSEKEHEALCSKTVDYLENFDPRLVNYDIASLYACLPHSANPNVVQSTLYSSVFCNKNNGITYPEKLRRYFPLKNLPPKQNLPQGGTSVENRVQLLEESVQALFKEVKILKELMGRRNTHYEERHSHDDLTTNKFEGMALDMAGLHKTISDLQLHNDHISGKIDSLTDTVVHLQEQSQVVENDVQDDNIDSDSDGYQPLISVRHKNTYSDSPTDSSSNKTRLPTVLLNHNNPQTISSVNRQYLMTLTAEQVGEVLVKLNMEHHKARFLFENITGVRLASFTNIDFSKLKVLEQSERDKLLQFITGQESVFPFML